MPDANVVTDSRLQAHALDYVRKNFGIALDRVSRGPYYYAYQG